MANVIPILYSESLLIKGSRHYLPKDPHAIVKYVVSHTNERHFGFSVELKTQNNNNFMWKLNYFLAPTNTYIQWSK